MRIESTSGVQVLRLTKFALCAWRILRLWPPKSKVNPPSPFQTQAPGRAGAAPKATGDRVGATTGGTPVHAPPPTANSPRRISAPAATPGYTPQAPAPIDQTGQPHRTRPPPTTQDNRCPGRWRSFPPDQVSWIEALIAFRPLRLSAWVLELRNDEDREFLLYLVEHGLSLTTGTGRNLTPFKCNNYKSAYAVSDLVQTALTPDIIDKRIFRPRAGFTSSFVHALGAVPKTVDSVRVIHDHSRPMGRSLNSHLTQSNFSFQSVDDAVRLLSRNCYMAKVDIEAAYRHVPIDPYDWELTAFCWPSDSLDDLYLDGYLQFGLKNACEVFNRIGRAIVRMMARRGFHCLVVYVDDFIIICPTQAMAWYAYWALRILLIKLGFKVNMRAHKCIAPCQVIDFLGVTLDSVAMQARLSPAKLAAISTLISDILRRTRLTRRELDKLNGKLNWVCKVIYGGRTFLRRLIDAQWSVTRPHHHVRLSAGLRLDLQWWDQFLHQFNGQTDLIPSRPLSMDEISTDASSSYGYGVFFMGGYFSLSFAEARDMFPDAPDSSEPIHIHELFAVLLLCRLYPTALSGLYVRLHIDNTIVVSVINKGTAKGVTGPRMMEYVRDIFWLSACHNFRLTSTYISSADNSLADALSRNDYPRFLCLLHDWKSGTHLALKSVASPVQTPPFPP